MGCVVSSVGARSSRPRRDVPTRGRHFLGPRSAAELVRAFEVGSADLVVEVGAGTGRLTRELARFAGLVLAIEIDPALSSTLLRSARSWPNVFVHRGDALDTQIPGPRSESSGTSRSISPPLSSGGSLGSIRSNAST